MAGSPVAPLAWKLPGTGVRASIAASRKIVLASSGVVPNTPYVSFAPVTPATSKYIEVTVTRVGVAAYSPAALLSPPSFAVGLGLGFGAPGTVHNPQRMPGWDPALIGYHSDDGSLFMGKPTADRALSAAWHAVGSVAGVGVFPPGAVISGSPASTWRLGFTLNGALVFERDLGAALDVTALQFAIGIIGDNVEVDVNGGTAPFRFGPANPGGVPEAPLVDAPVPVAALGSAPGGSGGAGGGTSISLGVIPLATRLQLAEAELARLRVSEAAAREGAALVRSDFTTLAPDALDLVVARLTSLLEAAVLAQRQRSAPGAMLDD